MHERLVGAGAHLRPKLQHAAQQVETHLVDLRENHAQVLRGIDMKVGLVFRELGDAWPGALRGGAHQPEDLLQLVLISRTGEQRAARVHFCHNTAGGPDVDAGVIGTAAEQDVWGAVPKGDHFVGEGVYGDAEGAGEAKIGQFQLALVVDQ